MDNYNSIPPVKHPGSSFATAALILGLLSVMTAFMGTVYPPLVFGGLAIILAILSRGCDPKYLTNAKIGLISGITGLIANVAVIASAFLLIYTNPQIQEEFHTTLNQYYEAVYGESFDDALEEIMEALDEYDSSEIEGD